jgi:hypothetical protein
MEPLTLVIPTFNEAATIGAAIREIPAAYRFDIIAADPAAARFRMAWQVRRRSQRGRAETPGGSLTGVRLRAPSRTRLHRYQPR